MKSILKKVKTIVKVGIDPYEEGKHNFENPNVEVEQLAKYRTTICITCPMIDKEPIPFLRVKDKRIKDLSENYCKSCGCSLPYKVRQSIDKCIKWQEE